MGSGFSNNDDDDEIEPEYEGDEMGDDDDFLVEDENDTEEDEEDLMDELGIGPIDLQVTSASDMIDKITAKKEEVPENEEPPSTDAEGPGEPSPSSSSMKDEYLSRQKKMSMDLLSLKKSAKVPSRAGGDDEPGEEYDEEKERQLEAALRDLKESLDEYQRKGADVSKPAALIDQAIAALDQKKLLKAESYTDRARKALDAVIDVFTTEQVNKRVSEITDLLYELEDEGVDIDEPAAMIEDARQVLAEDPSQALAFAHEAETQLETLRAQYETEQRKAEEELSEAIKRKNRELAIEQVESAEVLLEDYVDAGLELDDALACMDHAKQKLEAAAYNESLELARKAKHLAREAKKAHKIANIGEMLSNTESLLEEAAEEGIDVSQLDARLAVAKESLEENDFDRVTEILLEIKSGIPAARKEYYQQQYQEHHDRALAALEEIETEAIDTTEAEALLQEASDAYEATDYQRAYNTTSEALEIVQKLKDMEKFSAIERKIMRVRDHIDKYPDEGTQFERVNDLLERAEKFKIEKPKVATRLVTKAEEEVEEKITKIEKKRAIVAIRDLEKKIQRDSRAIDYSGVTETIQEARSYLKDAPARAKPIMERANREYDRKILDYRRDSIRDTIEETTRKMQTLAEAGLEIEDIRSLLDQAKMALDGDLFTDALDAVNESKALLEERMDDYEIQQLEESFEEARSKIAEAQEARYNTRSAENLYEKATQCFEQRDLDSARDYISRVSRALSKAEERYYKAKIDDEKLIINSMINKLETIDASTDEFRSALDMIDSKIEAGENQAAYDAAAKNARRAREEYESTLEEKTTGLAEEYRDKLEEAAQKKIGTPNSRILFNEAITEYEQEHYEQAYEILREVAAKYKKEYKRGVIRGYVDTMDAYFIILNNLRDEGKDVSEAERLLKGGKQALRKRQFKKIDESLHTIEELLGDDFQTYRKEHAEEVLEKYRRRLDELVQEGATGEVGRCRALIEELEREVEEGNYGSVFSSETRLQTQIEAVEAELQFDQLHERYDKLEQLDKRIKARGEDVGGVDVLFQTAATELEKRSVDDAQAALEKIEAKFEPYIMEFREEEYKSQLEALTARLEQLQAKGLELSAVESELGNAETMLLMGMVSDAKEPLNKAKKLIVAQENELLREKCTDQIGHLQTEVASLEEYGYQTDALESMLVEASEAVVEERFDAAAEQIESLETQIETSKEELVLQVLENQIEEARSTLARLEQYDQRAETAEEELGAVDEARQADDIPIALYHAFKSNRLARNRLYEIFEARWEEKFETVQRLFDNASDIGVDIVEVLEQFQTAKDKREERDYDDALELLDEVHATTSQLRTSYLIEHSDDALEHTERFLAEIETLGEDVSEPLQYLDAAREALATDQMNEFEIQLDAAMLAAEEIKNEYLRRALKERIEAFEERLAHLDELGLETGELQPQVEDAKKQYAIEDWTRVQSVLDDVEQQTEAIEQEYYESAAEEELESSIELITEMVDLGANVDEAEAILGEAKQAFKNESFKMSMEKAIAAREDAKEAGKQYMAEIVQSALINTENIIEECKDLGAEVSHCEELLDQAKAKYEEDDFDRAEELAKEAKVGAREIKNRELKVWCEANIAKTRDRIGEIGELDVDISDAGLLIHDAQAAYNEGDLELARSLVFQARETTEEVKNQYLEERSVRVIDETQDVLNELKDMGLDVAETQELLQKAEEALEAKDYAISLYYQFKAERSAKHQKRDFLDQRGQATVDYIRHQIGEVESYEQDTSGLEQLLVQAKDAMEEDDYASLDSYKREADAIAAEAREKGLHKRSINILIATQNYIEEVRKLGLEVDEAERFLQKSEAAYSMEEYEKVEENAKKAESLAKEVEQQYHAQKAIDTISAIQPVIEEIKVMGADVEEAENLFQKAQTEFYHKKYIEAKDYATKAGESAQKAKQLYQTKRAKECITIMKDAMLHLQKMGEESALASQLFSQAMQAAKNKNYSRLDEITERTESLVQEKRQRQTNLTSNAKEILKHRLDEVEARDVDVSQWRERLEELDELFEEEEFKRYTEELIQISEEVEVKLAERIIHAQELLMKTKGLVNALKEHGVMVSIPENLVRRAENEYEEENYKSAEQYLRKAADFAEELKTRHISDDAEFVVQVPGGEPIVPAEPVDLMPEEALAAAEAEAKKVEKPASLRERTIDLAFECREKIEVVEAEGGDASVAKTHFDEVRKGMRTRDFESAYRFAQLAMKTLTE